MHGILLSIFLQSNNCGININFPVLVLGLHAYYNFYCIFSIISYRQNLILGAYELASSFVLLDLTV